MDESGFPMAYAGKERVIGGRGTKTQHKHGGENMTAIITICADGTTAAGFWSKGRSWSRTGVKMMPSKSTLHDHKSDLKVYIRLHLFGKWNGRTERMAIRGLLSWDKKKNQNGFCFHDTVSHRFKNTNQGGQLDVWTLGNPAHCDVT